MPEPKIAKIITDLRAAIDAMETESQLGRHTGYVNQIEQLHQIIQQLQHGGQGDDKTWSSYGSSGQLANSALDEPGAIAPTGTTSVQQAQKSGGASLAGKLYNTSHVDGHDKK